VTRSRAVAIVATLATFAGCGGGGSKTEDETYRVGQARTCFENAGYQSSVREISTKPDVFRLTVFGEGAAGGPVYVTLIFAPRAVDAARYFRAQDRRRGNVVIRGPGADDDAVTQCMLEAKASG
jgi:hypothetical protein